MRLKLRNFLLVMLTVAAVTCLILGITACDGVKLTGITVENEKTDFVIGDEFSLGEYFTVYAYYSDDTKEDVTDKVEIRQETGFDMAKAGDYQITVSYEGKKFVYTIYVGNFENELRKIELDTTEVKKAYKVGESISFDGIKIISTLENAQHNNVISTTSSLKNFTVSIVSSNGNATDDVFTEFGTYTVTISKGAVKASYTVEVDGVDLSSVQGALTVGSLFKTEVRSGNVNFKSGTAGRDPILAFDTDYLFGNNYVYVEQDIYGATQLPDGTIVARFDRTTKTYCNTDEKGFFCINEEDGNFLPNTNAQAAMMGGPGILLWYNHQTEYGIENALNNLYSEAKKCTNKDLKETADEATRTYSFSFSGLVLTSNNSPDYYENTVTFKLDENYNIKEAEIIQSEWENDQAMLETDENWQVTFKTDPVTNITTPNSRYSSKIIVTVGQTAGKRTAESPYSRDKFTIQSYDLIYNGEKLDSENAVIKCSMAAPNLTFEISNFQPDTANLNIDRLYFNYEGNYGGYGTDVYFEGFMAYADGNVIKVRLWNGGVWKLYIKTANTLRTITFDVTGVAPESMTASIRNEGTGMFVPSDSKIMALNGEIYFCGTVPKYTNTAQTAVVTSANASTAKIEKITATGVTYFKFTATANGVYTVRVTSDAAPSVGCTFTFTVSDIPDYASILQGKYSVTDVEGNIYEVSFTPVSGEKISGAMTVKKTPTQDDGTPITAEAKTENYTYEVDVETFTINVTRVSGDKLAVLLSVNASGNLVLEDAYGKTYVLIKSNN